MTREIDYCLRPIGVVRSSLKERSGAPRQGDEGAPDVWIEIAPEVAEGLEGIEVNTDILVLTWLHQGRRDVVKVHPRGNKERAVRSFRDSVAGPAESPWASSRPSAGNFWAGD